MIATDRDIVLDALNHRQPARVPRDFGATGVTGLHCSLVAELREYFGLEKRLVKVFEPSSCIGWIDPDLAEAMGCAVAMPRPLASIYGFKLDEWREWRAPWGQDVLMPASFRYSHDANGDILVYPQGDTGVPPSGRLPLSSYFIDVIIRQEEIDDDDLDPARNIEEFGVMADDAVATVVDNCRAARADGRAVVLLLPGAALGDVGRVPGPGVKHPRGIRDIEEWYVSLALRPDYVRSVFELQVDLALENLKRLHRAGGDELCDVIHLCGADFGTQAGPLISMDTFDALYAPTYARLCGWVRDNTPWKTFKHSCGAVEPFIGPLSEAGFDIMNPVQCSAAGMDPATLKRRHGDRVTFWGGGVDTQRTLPFGTPEEVRAEVLERLRIFSPGGGFVFATVHNAQARTPVANFAAMLDALDEFERAGR